MHVEKAFLGGHVIDRGKQVGGYTVDITRRGEDMNFIFER